jgi:hypothetical protein
MSSVERIATAAIKDFSVRRAIDTTNVIKFSVEKEKRPHFGRRRLKTLSTKSQ